MAEEIAYKPQVLPGSETVSQETKPKKEEPKILEKPFSTTKPIQIDEDMPLEIFDSVANKPALINLVPELESLWNTNLQTAQSKVADVEMFIREELINAGLKPTYGAFKEYLDHVKKTVGFSKHRLPLSTLKQFHAYAKNFSKKKKK